MKPTGYYTPGNPKRERKPTWQWVQHMVNKAYTGPEWIEKFKSLPDLEKWKILQAVNPQPKQVDINQGVRVVLEIHGLEDPKVIEGKVVEPKALEMHQDDAE